MACGTPIIASDITGFREVIAGGREAVLVPPDDPAAWAAMTIALLEDPARRQEMSRAGLAKARTFDWSAVADRILAVYQRVIGKPVAISQRRARRPGVKVA
jgi:phosphatidylinositol alpha-mannosyltransferase